MKLFFTVACIVSTVTPAHVPKFRLSDLVNKNIGFPDKFGFQINCCC